MSVFEGRRGDDEIVSADDLATHLEVGRQFRVNMRGRGYERKYHQRCFDPVCECSATMAPPLGVGPMRADQQLGNGHCTDSQLTRWTKIIE